MKAEKQCECSGLYVDIQQLISIDIECPCGLFALSLFFDNFPYLSVEHLQFFVSNLLTPVILLLPFALYSTTNNRFRNQLTITYQDYIYKFIINPSQRLWIIPLSSKLFLLQVSTVCFENIVAPETHNIKDTNSPTVKQV